MPAETVFWAAAAPAISFDCGKGEDTCVENCCARVVEGRPLTAKATLGCDLEVAGVVETGEDVVWASRERVPDMVLDWLGLAAQRATACAWVCRKRSRDCYNLCCCVCPFFTLNGGIHKVTIGHMPSIV